jgi:hypothetical protein
VFSLPVVIAVPALYPTATLLSDVVNASNAPIPTPTLFSADEITPVVL